ncbi:MAG: sigma-70 family RNA polymerase sigma factor [Kineothrix sp.]|nr:sigma-70 family RNA polymerase sigma factor [Kineothrix sp.]NBI90625.1 sigma-70 family RNA polymerase sigma factor [Lachnospiraceae bacterium]
MLRNKEKEAEAPFEKYKDILYRIAFSNMKSKADAEDVVQEAFCRYLKAEPVFDNENHEKAWFIRVVINICYDIQKSAWFSRTVAFDEVPESEMEHFKLPFVEEDETLWHVMALPAAYRNPLYLFYYEDYSIKEIARIMELGEGTVKTRLRRGREMVKERILYGTGGKDGGFTDKALEEGGKDAD